MRLFAALFALCAALGFALPAPAADEYTPQVGQPGKDVIWVPTPDALVERMLDMAKATPRDFVVDLGSGDGRTVIAAAKRGIKALGIEYNPDMVKLSIRNAEKAGVQDTAKFVHGDVFASDFSQATVVTMYLLSSLNLKLRPTILGMKPGTRVVSHAFNMGDWNPDDTAEVEGYRAYLWIVPANVEGRWQVNSPAGSFELALEQKFQRIKAKATGSGASGNVSDARLDGPNIAFTVVDSTGRSQRYTGTVNGDTIDGTTHAGGSGERRWSARRKS
jgi:SAM-dependent methyltransferase